MEWSLDTVALFSVCMLRFCGTKGDGDVQRWKKIYCRNDFEMFTNSKGDGKLKLH